MSSVAGAVVTIDGDSSGLVGALQKGEHAMEGVKQEASKLSDQLREVTDDADKAAGALVQKLGGPAAIKAIAGVTAGFAAAKQVVDVFLESAESLFKSFGDEGVKVWDEVEKSLFKIKGAFAEAILGGEDMNKMAARLKVMFETVADVLEFLLAPLRFLMNIFWALRGEEDDLTAANDKYNESLEKTNELTQKNNQLTLARTAGIKSLYNQALRDIGLAQLAAQNDNLEAADKYNEAFNNLLSESATEAAKRLSENAIYVQDERDRIEGLILDITTGDPEAMRLAYGALAKAGMTEQIGMLEAFRQAKEKALAGAAAPMTTPQPTSVRAGGPREVAKEPDPEEMMLAFQDAHGEILLLTEEQKQAMVDYTIEVEGQTMTVVEIKRKEFADIAEMRADAQMQELKMEREQAERKAAIEEAAAEEKRRLEEAEKERKAREDEAEAKRKADKAKADAAFLYNITITQNAKLLANAILHNEKMGDVARAMIGNVVSALGDKAMVMAGEYAAAGDFVNASAMVAQGTTAYLIAGALGAEKKPAASAPTERQAPVTNYAYNLRIDASFADTESISRRFAEMQQGAERRGLIPKSV